MRRLFSFALIFILTGSLSLTASVENYSPAKQQSRQHTAAALAHDVMARNLTIPVYVEGGKMTLVQGAVTNVGENPESFTVEFGRMEWDGTFDVKRSKTVTDLSAGETASVSFGFFTFPKNIEHDYFIRVVLDGDMNQDNDVATQAVNSFTSMRDLVLIEKGTGTWCGYCPGSAVCVDSLFKAFPGQIAAIEYHAGDDYEYPQGRQRIDYYDLEYYPTAWFNGISEIVGGSSAYNIDGLWPQYKGKVRTALSRHGTCLEMAATYYEKNGRIMATTKLTGIATSYVRSFRLFYAVTESHIYKHWGGLDSLQHVFRGMYPSLDGIPVVGDSPIEEGWTFENEIEFDLPAGVVKENCRIVVFVQNIENRVIMAAANAQKVEAPVQMIAVSAQEALNQTGAPGDEFVTEGKIHNLTNEPVPVRLQKIPGTMPEDWSSSICIEFCLAPWVDVADDTIAANDSLEFSLHLYSGATADSGDIALKICTLADSSADQGANTFWLSLKGKTSWPEAVKNTANKSMSFRLIGAHPNPFNPNTTIEYSLAHNCTSVKLQVWSVLGRQIVERELSGINAGLHRITFDGAALAGGVYLYRIVYESAIGEHSLGFKKFTLLK